MWKSIGWKVSFLVSASVSLIFSGISASDWARSFEAKWVRRIHFGLRNSMGYGPKASQKLKVIAYDSVMFRSFGPIEGFPVSSLLTMFQEISQAKPQAIIAWGGLSAPLNSSSMDTIDAIKKQGVPILFPIHIDWNNRREFPEFPSGNLPKVDGRGVFPTHESATRRVQWIGTLASAMGTGGGHVFYDEERHSVIPAYVFDDDRFVPLLSLAASKTLRIQRNGIELDKHIVPLDSQRDIVPNLLSTTDMGENVYSMSSFFGTHEGKKKPVIAQDDVVFVKLDTSGDSDALINSSLGSYPLSLVDVSIANSMLTQQWIRPVADGLVSRIFLIVCASIMGVMTAFHTKVSSARLRLATGVAVIFALCTTLFVWKSIEMLWMFPLLAFSFSGALGSWIQSYLSRRPMSAHEATGHMSD